MKLASLKRTPIKLLTNNIFQIENQSTAFVITNRWVAIELSFVFCLQFALMIHCHGECQIHKKLDYHTKVNFFFVSRSSIPNRDDFNRFQIDRFHTDGRCCCWLIDEYKKVCKVYGAINT